MQIYGKQSSHNPLIKDKGNLSNSEQQQHDEDSAFMWAADHRQSKIMSCRITSTFEHTPIMQEHKVRGDSSLMRATQSMHVTALHDELQVSPEVQDVDQDEDEEESKRYILECESDQQLTLRPPASSQENDSSSSDFMNNDQKSHESSQECTKEKQDYQHEKNKLNQIEQIFKQKSTKNLVDSVKSPQARDGFQYTKLDTADFPMKLVTKGLLNDLSIESKFEDEEPTDFQKMLDLKKNTVGTPRFPTEEEIENEERRLLLSFAFKDEDEIETYRREINYVLNQEYKIDRPSEANIAKLRYQLRRYQPSERKTLVFCGIDGLFMFSTQAQIVKTFDRAVKIRKDGIKRHYKIFYRPHLYSFIKTLSQYFELALYLSEEEKVASQWVHVLNSFTDLKLYKGKEDEPDEIKNAPKDFQINPLKSKIQRKKTITEKFFDIILTREHCIKDRQFKGIHIRNKELLLEGRHLKDLIFVTTEVRDAYLISQNTIVVRPYHGNKYENTLTKLKIYLLKYLSECQDVRDVIRRDFLNHAKGGNRNAMNILSSAVQQMVQSKSTSLPSSITSQQIHQ